MNGEVFDILKHADGTQEMFYLGENLIVNGAYYLITSLLQNRLGMNGINYMDFGDGDASWDSNTALPTLVKTIDHLESKIVQKPTTVVFIDENLGTEVGTVTRKIEIRATVTDVDMTVNATIEPIREIGCRGGNADPASSDSYLFNYKVVRPLYQLATSESLERRFRITI